MVWKSKSCRRRRCKGNIPRAKEPTARANWQLVDDDHDDDKGNCWIGRERRNDRDSSCTQSGDGLRLLIGVEDM
ncbi:hypothetical protein KFK09_028319 [Dendrobium nobile]|uniref:Uncharacterized protein n=1 Tax=Dendrobium nobile TaxID=94219 RepID=A0A8T3A2B5_DENNO|nr:hypothetical protein KFK09_028319 [Dendrobium nobile]